ncbi:MAG: N-6 DNA methylase [Acidobacteria bacterium]|nr:N-6 DNA methylase [Acidobacteriota bacterium]
MSEETDSARALLDAAYKELGLEEGDLLNTKSSPNDLEVEQWVEKGEWLSLGKKIGIEKIFFVKDNPVIIFAESKTANVDAIRQRFNKAWCMARPTLLFLAQPGELSVYDLTNPPQRTVNEWLENKPVLNTVKNISNVYSELNKYRREQIESGRLFEDDRFGTANQRADQTLIDNLKHVRAKLIEAGLRGKNVKYAHALIGRSIFIRYLEDRGVLVEDYFRKVARGHSEWRRLLDTPPPEPNLDPGMAEVLYLRVLRDKDFTYALFDQLARDFNGDMFPTDLKEQKVVKEKHLLLLESFLRGEASGQRSLFFWAFKFDIIPIETISSIYEEFYHIENENNDSKGTHYTPSTLVEFILSKTLTPDCLARSPRVIDAATGSGIFLVEAFRRIVRYQVHKRRGRRLSFDELRKILREQIAGIEINEEAVRVAAFSLYLALLHYQEPPDILKHIKEGKRLPKLVYSDHATDDEHFNNLLGINAFEVEEKIEDEEVRRRFTTNCAEVVVGNPPWGSPDSDDAEGVAALQKAMEWCDRHGASVSDKERSQAFIWRSLSFLRKGGCAGLLVSTGVLLKQQKGSRDFRKELLKAVKVEHVVNFAHVRDLFFRDPKRKAKAISPFASVVFRNEVVTDRNHLIEYWSAKKTPQAKNLQAVILSQPDLHLIRQDDLRLNSDLWKILWWGNHRDAALISGLELFTPLSEIYDSERSGQGFSTAKKETQPSPQWLLKYKQLQVEKIQRYGPIESNWFEPAPRRVKRLGKRDVYSGTRLLIKHGITQSSDTKGQIIARVESDPFCFSNSINGIKLVNAEGWEYLVVLGILWSSLTRYYFFLTSSKWGMWHFGIHKKEYLRMPIKLPNDKNLRGRIVDIVNKLREWSPAHRDAELPLFNIQGKSKEEIEAELRQIEYELDEAIFDLYELNASERDLVRDMCDVGIDFFYKPLDSVAVKPLAGTGTLSKSGLLSDITSDRDQQSDLEEYIYTFLHVWNRQVAPEGEFNWRYIQTSGDWPLLVVVFSPERKGEGNVQREFSGADQDAWEKTLNVLEKDLLVPYKSQNIYIDGMVRAVTDTSIIIIKRNERRLWTRSSARDDAEATLLQAINLQESGKVLRGRENSPHQPAHLG